MKTHKFVVIAKTNQSKKAAKTAILLAFSLRNPDYCEFYVKGLGSKKKGVVV